MTANRGNKILDDQLHSELLGLLTDTIEDNEDAPSSDALISAGKEHDDVDSLKQAFPSVDQRAAALAFVIGQADQERYEAALSYMVRVGSLTGKEPVRNFIKALNAQLPEPDFDQPYVDLDGNPVTFVVSFPRSGNTHLIQLLTHSLRAGIATAHFGNRAHFSRKVRTIGYRSPVFVKDHGIRDAYRHNPVIYQHRDGRDSLLSFNDFTAQGTNRSRPEDIPALSDSLGPVIERLKKTNYGTWNENVDAALAHHDKYGNVVISRYDDLTGPNAFASLRDTLAAINIELTEKAYAAASERSQKNATRLRSQNVQWGKAPIYPEGSMMDRWLKIGSGSRWRAVLSAEDKSLLHSIGMTETLMKIGYETNEDWWRA
ncbi:hypothetical protein L1787_06845 [Acuticoccus sp. M5D2P5]|uniref:hypothetical protein n=1 Tax=Acuticoccus kalidii TaxID=2910977 RepID=UPI001F3B84BF|nr:hypothetical protein [Acuticoccus kalidii]MCF3933131.1 hypothetical protein [Acuticoccus kalidii]